MSRYSIRLTRFDDRGSFRSVVEFLARLYPERSPAEFEAGLARLPCLITESADGIAMSALKAALERRGARVLAMPTVDRRVEEDEDLDLEIDDEDGDPAGSSQEIDAAFLQRGRTRSARAPAPGVGASRPAEGKGEVPWEGSASSGEQSKAPWEH